METAIAAFTDVGEPRWRAFERLLENVRTEWNARPRHPDPVFARDGWRCGIPTCSARRSLHNHHIVFRSRGGDNDPLIASRSARRITNTGCTPAGTSVPGERRRTGFTGSSASGAMRRRCLTLIGDRYVSDS